MAIRFQDPCYCGNIDPVKYRHYREVGGRLLGKRCNECAVEWLVSEYQSDSLDSTDSPNAIAYLYRRDPPELKENTALQIHESKTKLDWKFDCLKSGDHIAWQRTIGYWHHAILDEINDWGIVVIHWKQVDTFRIEIVQEWISHVEEGQDTLYKVDYPEEITKANSRELVLARARSRIGDSGYGLLKDNCESFSTFCKTGSEKSHQVAWLDAKLKEFFGEVFVTLAKTSLKSGCRYATTITQKAMDEIAKGVVSAVAAAGGDITEEGMKKILANISSKVAGTVQKAIQECSDETVGSLLKEYAGKVTAAEMLERVNNSTDLVGAGIVVLVEGYLLIRDLRRTHRSRINGNISRRDFVREATQRSVEGISTAGFTIAGSLVGSSIGPFGTFLGSVVGGAVGCFLGKFVGTLGGSNLGRAISDKFEDDRAIVNLKDLKPGAHVLLKCRGGCPCPNRKCHAIVTKHNGKDRIKVIRNTEEMGVVEEWVEFTQPLFRIEHDQSESGHPEKVVLYANLKKFEDYRYHRSEYNCETFARECVLKSKLL